MTIEITRPELEALIESRLQYGPFQDIQDLLLDALAAAAPREPATLEARRFEIEDGFPVLHTGVPMTSTVADDTLAAIRRERDFANLGRI
ncbi:MAG: hypothetical protein IT168_04800 [Bryobacterales bacterium]|nr:hypothetical protein [Bryobacterales bacterium]